MRKILLVFTCIISIQVMAQEEKLCITFNVGNDIELNVNEVNEISFVEDENPLNVLGEWFCEAKELGTFEAIDFHADGTLKYFYYYISYKSGGTLLGTYSFEDYMFNISINNLGSMTYPVINHSAFNYTARISGKDFNYYKVRKTYYMTVTDTPISIGNDGDSVTFVDNIIIGLENNKIKALGNGTGYALVWDSGLNEIVAYKVIVGTI